MSDDNPVPVNGERALIIHRLNEQDRMLQKIEAAIEELKRPRSDWKPLIGLFAVFMVALGAVCYPLRRDVDDLRKSDAVIRESYTKDIEMLRKDIDGIKRENVWNWDGQKARLDNLTKNMDRWFEQNKKATP